MDLDALTDLQRARCSQFLAELRGEPWRPGVWPPGPLPEGDELLALTLHLRNRTEQEDGERHAFMANHVPLESELPAGVVPLRRRSKGAAS